MNCDEDELKWEGVVEELKWEGAVKSGDHNVDDCDEGLYDCGGESCDNEVYLRCCGDNNLRLIRWLL